MVRIGVAGAYPPFNDLDRNGKLVGFDVDIAQALCNAADYECTFVVQSWKDIIPGLLARKYDAIISSLAITEENKELVDFTDPYYRTPAKFVARQGTHFDPSPGGLSGQSVGVRENTNDERFVRAAFPEADIRVYPTQDAANRDLVAGKIDLTLGDAVALRDGFLKTEMGRGFDFVGPDYNHPGWHGPGAGIAVRKGDDQLREGFNAAIKSIRTSGVYQRIQRRYFTFDVYGPSDG
jgi:lysine-arginine-ornithine-binding protein